MQKGKARTARKYRIAGRVQGVGFRYFAERAAHALGLSGYVKNRADGTVEVYAIGDDSSLDVFQHKLAEGPRSAWVEAVQESDAPVNDGYKDFSIESGW